MKHDLTTTAPTGAVNLIPAPPRLTMLRRILSALGLARFMPQAARAETTTAFTAALIALSAKLAKSDGVASRVEAEAFERLHEIVPGEVGNVRRMFDAAARDVAGFDAYAEDMGRMLGADRGVRRNVLEGLFHIATADGILHPEEEKHLQRAAAAFGFGAGEFRAIRGLYVHDPGDAYTILGLKPDASPANIKARYKQLVREHHPDRLTGTGMPSEYVRFATAKLAEINAAYEQIARERGL